MGRLRVTSSAWYALHVQDDAYITSENAKRKIAAWNVELSQYHNRWQKLQLSSSALLVIDMQEYFLRPDSHAFVPSVPFILKNVQALVQDFRARRLPVVFTRFAIVAGESDPIGRFWADTVREGSPESCIVRGLEPRPGEKVIRKRSYSAFHGTGLEAALREKGVTSVVLTGVLTNLCCETAAREAFCRDFDVYIVMDATAAYTEEMHIASLKSLAYGCATPLAVSDILRPTVCS